MHEHSFFVAPENQDENFVYIKGDEYRHCCNVLRKSEGAEVLVFDGQGNRKKVKLIEEQNKSVKARVLKIYPKRENEQPSIILGVGIVRNKAMKRIIDQATSLGIEKFYPLKMQNCIKYNFKRDKFVKKSIQAAKQSGNATLPEINNATSLKEWFAKTQNLALKLIALQDSEQSIADINKTNPGIESIGVMVGPEGGFHDREIEQARDAGFVPVNISPYRLRAELAVTNILSGIYHLND